MLTNRVEQKISFKGFRYINCPLLYSIYEEFCIHYVVVSIVDIIDIGFILIFAYFYVPLRYIYSNITLLNPYLSDVPY